MADRFQKEMRQICLKYKQTKLSPEYSYYFQENMLHILILLARYKFIAKQLKCQDRILDLGCGCGIGSLFLAQHCKSVIGLDINEGEIKLAQKLSQRKNIDFKNEDFFDHPTTERYDVVIAIDVIEHLSAKRAERLLEKIQWHLLPKGMLVIGTPSLYSRKYSSLLSRLGHKKMYSQAELASLIEKYYGRVLSFSMNDEIVHTGHPKMAWYYFFLGFGRKYV